MIGTTIEHYRITERLGGGGMGEVYRAMDLELDREVAIKSVRADLTDMEEVTERFRAEARTLARLSHQNIATVYHFFARDTQLFLVMEYVTGSHFGSMLRNQGALPYPRAVDLLRQALSGLGYAHARKVVHRDIKPTNLMVDRAGTVKVVDFGIAHVLDMSRLTRTGSVVGTPAYMAPEQALGQPVDARTDIYSLGIVLYEMLTGNLPYQGNSDFELMRAHVESAPRPVDELSPAVPRSLQSAIMTALAKDKSDRFQTAGEFAEALAATDEHSTFVRSPAPAAIPAAAAAEAETEAVRSDTITIRKPDRNTVFAALAGAGLVLALALGGWLLQDSGDEPNGDPAGSVATPTEPPGATDPGVEASDAVADADGASTEVQGTGADTEPEPAGDPVATTDSGTASAPTTSAPADTRSDAGTSTTSTSRPAPQPSTPIATPVRPAQPSSSSTREPVARPADPLPQASVQVRKISVHERQRTGRFSRAAGYNGDFRLVVPSGTSAGGLDVEEFLEVRQDGREVWRELIHAAPRQPGIFESKQRVQALKELNPGLYDLRLVFVSDGITLGAHEWKLEVVD